MRSQREIQHQLKQVTYRHLQKRLRDLFKQRPTTCYHNREVILDDEAVVHLCGYLSSEAVPRNLPCDDRIPGCAEMAKECPLWKPLKPKDQVKAEFQVVLQSGDRGAIAVDFPDVAALMWVLDSSDYAPLEDDIVLAEPPRVRWWSNFFRWDS